MQRPPDSCIFAAEVQPLVLLAWHEDQLYAAQERCPPAALVGMDATPSVGLRGPTNFAGWLTAEQTGQVDAELASLRYIA